MYPECELFSEDKSFLYFWGVNEGMYMKCLENEIKFYENLQ